MDNQGQNLKIFFLASIFFLSLFFADGASYTSVSSGNWDSPSTWGSASFPVAGDNVTIANGHTITVVSDAACSAIVFAGPTGDLSVSASVTLTVSGSVTFYKQEASAATYNLSGQGTMICAGLAVGSTNNVPTANALYLHTCISTISYLYVTGNIEINSYRAGANRRRHGVFNHESGMVSISGSIKTYNEHNSNVSAFNMASGAQTGTLILSGATPFDLYASGTSTITLNGSASLVNYNRSGNQVIHGTTHTHLTLSGSGVKTITGATVNGVLSVEDSATTTGTAPSFGASATLQYKGSVAQTTGVEFPAAFSSSGGIIIDNPDGVTLDGDRAISSSLVLAEGEFMIGSNTITFHSSDNPVVKSDGTITTTSGSGISFGDAANTGGAAFILPDGTFTTAPEINGLTVYRTNGITLNDQMLSVNGIVLCHGPLNTNGNLTLLSAGSGTALVDGSGTGTISGEVTMQRYLSPGFGYKYFSSPFQAATVGEFGDDMDLDAAFPSFYRYDENRLVGGIPASGWVKYTNPAGILNPMEGYAVNFGDASDPVTVDVSGTVNNGSLSIILYNNDHPYTKGFNLVGNPYPSPIDWDAPSGWTKTNIDDALYYFRAGTTDQYGGTYSTYVNGISSDGLATNIIPSMQGFFVHVTDGSYPVTGTLGVDNSVRITDLTHPFLKSARLSQKPLIRLTAGFSDEPASADPLVIYLDKRATPEFDSEFDALKLTNTDLNVANLYSVTPDGKKLSIDALPYITDSMYTVPLGLKIFREGNVTFCLSHTERLFHEMGLYLFDLATGVEQDLLADREYTVFLSAGDHNDRFFLHLTNTPAGEHIVSSEPGTFSIHCYRGMVRAEFHLPPGETGTLMIHNLPGKTLFTEKIFEPGSLEFYPGLINGIYIATFFTGSTRYTEKLMIINP